MLSKDLAVFLLSSFTLAALADAWLYFAREAVTGPIMPALLHLLWGFLRMYTPTVGALLALRLSGRSLREELAGYLGISTRAVLHYFASPLLVYLALGVYVLLGLVAGLVDLGKPERLLLPLLQQLQPTAAAELARLLLLVQVASAYIAAVTVNAFFALGEEIGWRGYMYRRLGSQPNLRSIVAIGVTWGLWHATAIGLLGHNYPELRWAGVPLFTLFCILLSAVMLPLVTHARSILPAVSLHGALNALWGLTVLVTGLEGAEGEALGGLGALGLLSLAVVYLVLRMLLSRLAGRG
uniref:CPBP family intramembrane metalloprotease n=1 Tax=Thermofilum pendens TaxID=2269 RepID=A0A7C4F8X4_THEPE